MPVVEEEAADRVDVAVVGERDLDERVARTCSVCRSTISAQRVEHAVAHAVQVERSWSPRLRLTSRPVRVVESDATGEGPE